jgi:hypothetical protein
VRNVSTRYLQVYRATDAEILLCISRRFATFDVNPRLASPNDTITVTGRLEYHDPICRWLAAGGDKVELYIDGGKRGEATTQADGSFKFMFTGKDVGLGKHVVYCYAPSFWRVIMPVCDVKSDERILEVVTEEEKEERQRQELTMNMLTYGLIAAGVVAAIGVAIGLYQRERQRQLMMMLMAKRAK